MSGLSVLNAARTAIDGSSSHPVYIANKLAVDVDGNLIVPNDPTLFILHLILDDPTFSWGQLRGRTIRLQLDAWSVTEGEAFAMLDLVEPALITSGFIPLARRDLGRDGSHTGATQDYERGTS